MSCGNDTCRGNANTRVVKCHARCHDSSRGKKFFHGKSRIFTCQILRGTMRVHACKSEVINERYCTLYFAGIGTPNKFDGKYAALNQRSPTNPL